MLDEVEENFTKNYKLFRLKNYLMDVKSETGGLNATSHRIYEILAS